MKKSMSLLTNLLLSSTLFWGVPSASGQEAILRVPVESTGYCHMKFPSIREDTLFSVNPTFDESAGNIIDFYGSCDHDPPGVDEVRTQKKLLLRGYSSDGE
ncbi:MAG: hypothetical protein GEU77_14345 [Deltaproteobacteria bacterium]|nr:hypothetical protein [Deltaproteobacteria bacterium]